MTRHIGEQAGAILASVEVLAELELQLCQSALRRRLQLRRCPVEWDSARSMRGQPPSAACPERSRRVRERSPLASAPCPSSAAGAQSKAQRCSRSPNHRGTRRRPPAVSHHQAPNTGGKTVTLKTVGLLALMAQSGIPVPADRAEMPVFDAVSPISATTNRSSRTFRTSPRTSPNIDFISRTATAQSLVLLDELGSATDPEEGAALAVAIAGYFGQIGLHDRHLHSPHFLESLRRKYSRSDQRLR